FKAFVVVGLGVKCSEEVATAIRGAIILAKLIVIHPKPPSPLLPLCRFEL
ncbi:40S ribosomal protein S2-4-like, partial [Trifolium medium]|nr:40S ribosomal protein S2-4-like [Trifolium medium]